MTSRPSKFASWGNPFLKCQWPAGLQSLTLAKDFSQSLCTRFHFNQGLNSLNNVAFPAGLQSLMLGIGTSNRPICWGLILFSLRWTTFECSALPITTALHVASPSYVRHRLRFSRSLAAFRRRGYGAGIHVPASKSLSIHILCHYFLRFFSDASRRLVLPALRRAMLVAAPAEQDLNGCELLLDVP